jgi:hypothetical protein
MSGAVCPTCGVPVVPGYVRCPKCHTPLPQNMRRAGTVAEGGTALPSSSRTPIVVAIGLAVLGGVVIVVLGMRGHGKAPAAAAPPDAAVAAPAADDTPPNTRLAPAAPDVTLDKPDQTRPSAGDLATKLEHELDHQQLWSTVSVVGNHVDVRSGSCDDPAMPGYLASAAAGFKAAGLTRLRCLSQSGQVVIDRAL